VEDAMLENHQVYAIAVVVKLFAPVSVTGLQEPTEFQEGMEVTEGHQMSLNCDLDALKVNE
jgi:hypothetical protein